jgi:hypothetical protein
MRVDRLLGELGIGQDSVAGRQEFERQMERRRLEALDEEALKRLRRGRYLGSEQFKEQMLELMEGKLGESHSGELHRETAEPRANRIIAAELARRGRAAVRVGHSPTQRPRKVAIAARLRSETPLPIKWIAARVQIGTAKGAKSVLPHLAQSQDQRRTASALEPCAQLEFQSTVIPFPGSPPLGICDLMVPIRPQTGIPPKSAPARYCRNG